MVSKTMQIAPSGALKGSKPCSRPYLKMKNNVIDITSLFFVSANKSLCKIFARLAEFAICKSHQKRNYQVLSKLKSPIPKHLPQLTSPDTTTIVFDLDKTLIHAKFNYPPDKFDFIIRPIIDDEEMTFYVQKRPGVDELLAAAVGKYEVVVFTAGVKEYASQVLDQLDPSATIKHRLYRDSCRRINGNYVKDLETLGRDLRRVTIVDDNPVAYALQPENAIPMKPFTGNFEDRELERLGGFLEWADRFDDMRDAVKHYL